MRRADGMEMNAILSDDGAYRYKLTRVWEMGQRVTWIMLNPSTADAYVDDPTIRRCVDFARRWGFYGINVVNLFALRSPSPKLLRQHHDPVGPANDRWLGEILVDSDYVVAAWGAHGSLNNRGSHVRSMADYAGKPMHVLGLTKDGQPKHPLYIPGPTQPMLWTPSC